MNNDEQKYADESMMGGENEHIYVETYRNQLHIPFGWRLQSENRGKERRDWNRNQDQEGEKNNK